MEGRHNCSEAGGFPSPVIVFSSFPHINGSLELVLKSDKVPNDRIWMEIK
jgi:hypothetical protein